MRITKQFSSLVVVLGLAGGPTAAGGEAEKTFYHAFYLESALRDLAPASEAYAKAMTLAAQEDDPRLLTQSLVGYGRCLAALGRHDEARRAFADALERDPDNVEARRGAALGSDATADIDPELRARMAAYVQQLDTDQVATAQAQLKLAKERAVPFLAQGLRSRSPVQVQRSAETLVMLGGAGVIEALQAALLDEEVMFKGVIGDAMSGLQPGPAGLPLIRVALDQRTPAVRVAAARLLGGLLHEQGDLRDEIERMIRQALGDADVAVRLWMWNAKFPPAWLTRLSDELRRAAQSPNASERLDVVRLCAEEEAQRFGDVLIAACRDEDADVRSQAIRAATRAAASGFVQPSAVRAAIAPWLAAADEREVQDAAEALYSLEAPWDAASAEPLAVALAAQNDGRFGSSTAKALDKLLERTAAAQHLSIARLVELNVSGGQNDHPAVPVRRNAAAGQALWQALMRNVASIEPAERAAVLERLFPSDGSEVALVRWCQAAGAMALPAAVPRLVAVAAAEAPAVRTAAYLALAACGFCDLGRLPRLADDLAGAAPTDSGGRIIFLPGLELILGCRNEAAVPLLRQVLNRACGQEACAFSSRVLSALVEILGDGALPDLQAGMFAQDFGLAFVATRTLVEMRGEQAATDIAAALERVAADQPLHAVTQLDPAILAGLVRAIRPAAIPTELVSAGGRLSAADLHLLLEKVAQGAPPLSVAKAIQVAASYGSLADLEPLAALAVSGSVEVRVSVARAMALIRQRGAAADGLAPAQRSAALQRARELATAKDPLQRRGAAAALAALRDASAVPVLLDLLADPEATVRTAAVEALEKLGRTVTAEAPVAPQADD